MKKQFFVRSVAMLLSASSLLLFGCGGGNDGGHTHDFSVKLAEEKYLKSAADCSSPAEYYMSCACGEAGDETFTSGSKAAHDYSAENIAPEYLKAEATCQENAVYYKSCTYCGKRGYDFNTFTVEGFGDHAYTKQIADFRYVHTEATLEAAATFYKTCVCGAVGTETFSYGEPLREYTAEEKVALTPNTLTMTLYDTAETVYGFTYNTQIQPLRPVIQIAAGEVLGEAFKEYPCSVKKYTSYEEGSNGDVEITYYVVKAEVPMENLSTYTYRAYDKYAQVGTEPVTVQTKDVTSTAFSFAHVSDSQVSGTSTGTLFGSILAKLSGNNDFILHTGDIVQTAKYESQFSDMLGGNFQYLSKLLMMAVVGNHEGNYVGVEGTYELQKHFNYKLPQQTASWTGAYYSFTYGNAKFIMLNANDRGSDNRIKTEQYSWLVNELKNNTATWTIVAMHQPMYSPGSWGSDPAKNAVSLALRAQLKKLFADYGVDLVLQGHDHVVSRTYPMDANGSVTEETWKTVDGVNYSVDPSGVIYVMNGCAGNQGREPLTSAEAVYSYQMKSSARSWAEITIDGNRLTVSPRYIYGSGYAQYEGATWGIEKTVS